MHFTSYSKKKTPFNPLPSELTRKVNKKNKFLSYSLSFSFSLFVYPWARHRNSTSFNSINVASFTISKILQIIFLYPLPLQPGGEKAQRNNNERVIFCLAYTIILNNVFSESFPLLSFFFTICSATTFCLQYSALKNFCA